jgi:large subunit ribosomal protein L13
MIMKIEHPEEYEIVDATDMILGRLGSVVAKELVKGKKIAVINAEKAVITGNRNLNLKRYKIKVDLKNKMNPNHSPYISRRPDLFVKRSIRGMLPYRRTKGKDAYHKLLVFMGHPTELKKSKKIEVEGKDLNLLYVKYITISELSKRLGYKVK